MSLPDRSSASTFDAINKINNAQIPPSVQATDWDNPSLARAISDVAGLGQAAPRFWCRLTLAASTGALVLVDWEAVWGNATSTSPVVTRLNTGIFTVSVPSVVSDEYDKSINIADNITVNLSGANANLEGTTAGFINSQASGNLITVHTFNVAGSANDLVGLTAFIVAY
jgi:hypothetical protein